MFSYLRGCLCIAELIQVFLGDGHHGFTGGFMTMSKTTNYLVLFRYFIYEAINLLMFRFSFYGAFHWILIKNQMNKSWRFWDPVSSCTGYSSLIAWLLCCPGAVRRWPGGGLSDRRGGEPSGWQQHFRELHSHQQHWGEWHRRGDHVSRNGFIVKLSTKNVHGCNFIKKALVSLLNRRNGCWQKYFHRSGENDVDFIGNLDTEEGELPDDLAGATGII